MGELGVKAVEDTAMRAKRKRDAKPQQPDARMVAKYHTPPLHHRQLGPGIIIGRGRTGGAMLAP